MDVVRAIEPGTWFVTIDLKEAYFYVPIAEEHRQFLRFSFQHKAYQYRVLPFGLSLAPRVFTKCVQAALEPLQAEGMLVLPYLDDWLLCAATQEQAMADTSRLLRHALLTWAETRFLSLRATHIPGHLNVVPDALSRRRQRAGDWHLHKEVVQKIWNTYGTATVDLFASKETTHCPLWYAEMAELESLGRDALTHEWPDVLLFAFPPIPLIWGVLNRLFIFTDGEVGNTKDVLNCVRSNADFHRCFSFGIGEGASSALITGLAENSSGHAQFITGTERMQAKVMQSLHYALQPAVTDITEDWTDVSFTRLSPPIKTLFHGQRALIYAHLKGEECQNPDAKGKISVRYCLGDQEVSNTVHFSLKPSENSGLAIHRLGARSLIRSLERDEQDDGADKEALKARVVDLSKQSGVSSSHTAFIAINKGSGQAVKGPMVKRRIPIASMGMSRGLCGSSPFGVLNSRVFKKVGMLKLASCKAKISTSKISEAPKDPLLQLISLQKASGCWKMGSTLAEVFGKGEKELVEQIPSQMKPDVWATLLALIWLHGFKINAQVEWQILAMKAVAWIRTQKVVNQSECVQVGNALLGCQVKEDALGL
ncbi:von Willebrand factor A domain-containing protein 5A-like [Neoarius graeffei]|uniref:von Willebrand factor A domain-containing protein 5A-like n=1 Tax=Neoarius graeffei TaxID=443677 RepID=UPI00298C94F9|nr:von Willebrand factor A domain-containing protein 5A-like [Neoarius graeffei]